MSSYNAIPSFPIGVKTKRFIGAQEEYPVWVSRYSASRVFP